MTDTGRQSSVERMGQLGNHFASGVWDGMFIIRIVYINPGWSAPFCIVASLMIDYAKCFIQGNLVTMDT